MAQAHISKDNGYGHHPRTEDGGRVARYSRAAVENEVHLALQIDNYFQIGAVYGQWAADRAVTEVCNALLTLGGRKDAATRTHVLPDGDGRLKAIFWSSTVDVRSLVHACCVTLGTTPIPCGKASVVPVISVGFPAANLAAEGAERDAVLLRSADEALELAAVGNGISGFGVTATAAPVFESDMALAADLLSAMAEGPVLAWQPVRNADSACDMLYREALLRAVNDDGTPMSPVIGLQAIERLGLTMALDCVVVSHVLDELEASSQDVCLAVNISARSARCSFWWSEVFARLARDRSLASRLLVEITETAPLPSISEAVAFVDRLRAFGCTIAIDDFGVGYSSIRTLLALRPDIVKINALFLHRAACTDTDRRAFEHLVGLAESLAPTVVVEGVQTDEQRKLARDAGAFWQQGYHHGAPSLCRPWRGRHVEFVVPAPLQDAALNVDRRQAVQ